MPKDSCVLPGSLLIDSFFKEIMREGSTQSICLKIMQDIASLTSNSGKKFQIENWFEVLSKVKWISNT